MFAIKKEDRLKKYVKMLEAWICLDRFTHLGFCCYIYNNFNLDFKCGQDFKDAFPELYLQKPHKYSLFWWDTEDRESRIDALKKAIKLCEDE